MATRRARSLVVSSITHPSRMIVQTYMHDHARATERAHATHA
ncbi:hypothetical protein YT1_2231 [Rhodococcus ruber]|nr:hypothetical protein YT1_2231 [Rhodococcus ruber]